MGFFADTVLQYFDSGAGPIPGPYGFVDPNGNGFTDPGEPDFGPIGLDAVLGDELAPSLNALSLPTGSFVTVGFNNAFIINGPGDDIFIRENGPAGDRAQVYVSSKISTNPADFVLLGIAEDDTTTALDLSTIGFNQPVRAVKIVGLDNNGTVPGFDVVNVQALQVLTLKGDRILTGSSFNDIITGGTGNDFLIGSFGNDVLVGEAGSDELSGDSGDDTLNGGKGNDKLNGGEGSDKIFCGQGRDLVVLAQGFGADKIKDFGDRKDKLELPDGIKFKNLTLTQQGKNTLISFKSDLLATLTGISVSQITVADVTLA